MAERPILRLRSLAPGSLSGARGALETEPDWSAGDAPTLQQIPGALSKRTARVADKTIPESVVDVALDLVLNEIAHEARSITTATGSAVLLIRGGVPVCRSVSGATAREASAYLSECSGLVWRSGTPQHCHDVEKDSRFDLASLRRLGIGSFLIVPVQDDKKAVVAIMQTFSSRPHGFGDRDLLALLGLGRHIVDYLEAAEHTFASIPKIAREAKWGIAPGEKTPLRFAQSFNTAKRAFYARHVV